MTDSYVYVDKYGELWEAVFIATPMGYMVKVYNLQESVWIGLHDDGFMNFIECKGLVYLGRL